MTLLKVKEAKLHLMDAPTKDTNLHAVWLNTARHRKTPGNVSCGRIRPKYHTL